MHQVVKTLKSRIDDPLEWDFTKQLVYINFVPGILIYNDECAIE